MFDVRILNEFHKIIINNYCEMEDIMKQGEKTKVIEDETTIYEIDLDCLNSIKSEKENDIKQSEKINE